MAIRNNTKLALSALTLSLLLSAVGCGGGESGGGGGSSSATPPPGANEIIDTHVTGSVGDGPVVGARIRVFSKTGAVLMEGQSSGTADYDLTIKTQGKNYAVRIVADQGTDLVTGAAPDFRLVSAITRPNNRTISNLNPFSTLIYETARTSGGIDDTRVGNARSAVVNRYGFGLDQAIIGDPTNTPINNNNVHVIVKSSETLGEMIRRTRDAMMSTGDNLDGDAVVDRLAADLSDGWIDGKGAAGHDPRTAAVANVASAAVLVQAMANRLHVYGFNATSAMDVAIGSVRPGSNFTVGDVRIPATALQQAERALAAAMVVSTDPVVNQALNVVRNTKPGASAETVAAALPAGIDAALEQATLDAAFASTTQVDSINAAGSAQPDGTGFAKVSWTPPTEREDGSALGGIDHYTVYYGQDSTNLDQSVTVDGALTSQQVSGLGQGTWYFAVTATASDGLESSKSAVASKTIG